jgi:SAM-dependent methyltransferase
MSLEAVRPSGMMTAADSRENATRDSDLGPEYPEDVPFYQQRIPSPQARVLELGCGTGRLLVPLAGKCRRILGLDASEALLALNRWGGYSREPYSEGPELIVEFAGSAWQPPVALAGPSWTG